MNIVVLSQWFPPENAPIPSDIAHGLATAGHDVTVLTGFPNYPNGRLYPGWRQRPWLDAASPDGYKVRRVALYPSHDESALRRAAGYVSFGLTSSAFGWRALRRADVVYVYHPPLTSALGPWLSRALGGAPFVLHVQDLWPESVLAAGMMGGPASRAAGAVLNGACNAVYRSAAAIIGIAPTMVSTLSNRVSDSNKVHVVPNWADEDTFFPAERDPALASELGLAGTFSLMFAGNIGHLQALDVAVRAAATLRDLPDFRLVLVGDGVARESLQDLARAAGADNVRFVPARPRSEINAVTGCADVQLVSLRNLPFFRGTIPSKLATVMASGLPVICTVDGDSRDVVAEGGAGWTCPAEDVEALAKTVRLAHDATPEERAALDRAGHAYYRERLSRDASIARIEEILRDARASDRRRRVL